MGVCSVSMFGAWMRASLAGFVGTLAVSACVQLCENGRVCNCVCVRERERVCIQVCVFVFERQCVFVAS